MTTYAGFAKRLAKEGFEYDDVMKSINKIIDTYDEFITTDEELEKLVRDDLCI